MSGRKGKKKSPDKDTEPPVVGVIAACGCTVQKVYCTTRGPQTVAKNTRERKEQKKLKQKITTLTLVQAYVGIEDCVQCPLLRH